MYIRPKIAEAILDKVTEIQIKIFEMLLDEVGDYTTLVTTLDDLGAQTTALLNPDLYRKYLKPRQKKLIDFIHSKTAAKIYYHSCGNMEAFISDLIDIGVDALNTSSARERPNSPTHEAHSITCRTAGTRSCVLFSPSRQPGLHESPESLLAVGNSPPDVSPHGHAQKHLCVNKRA